MALFVPHCRSAHGTSFPIITQGWLCFMHRRSSNLMTRVRPLEPRCWSKSASTSRLLRANVTAHLLTVLQCFGFFGVGWLQKVESERRGICGRRVALACNNVGKSPGSSSDWRTHHLGWETRELQGSRFRLSGIVGGAYSRTKLSMMTTSYQFETCSVRD